MNDNKNPDNELNPDQGSPKHAHHTGEVDHTRRRVATSGLAASVLLTLASRPVLGATSTCQSPSGFQSGNVSQPGTPVACLGRTPGYWKTHPDWPTPYNSGTSVATAAAAPTSSGRGKRIINDATNFKPSTSSAAGTVVANGTPFHPTFSGAKMNKPGTSTSYLMMEVLGLEGYNDKYKLGAHICAALLNAKMGWTPVLTEDAVKRIWYEYDTSGYFEPTSGVQWTGEQIVTYLQSTMTL